MNASLPALPVAPDASARTRVCIATFEIVGPSRNGGIGTAYFSLAVALAEAGIDVTILYLWRHFCASATLDDWKKYYGERGIDFVVLPAPPVKIDALPNASVSYEAYLWLKNKNFDVIHFPELPGHGYYSVLAKHQGLDFQNTTIVVGAHSPISWIRQLSKEYYDGLDDLEIDFMERSAVAWADVVISPSRYLLNWMVRNGWTLPSRCYVQQYILSPELWSRWTRGDPDTRSHPVREFVFFGRLEERKGLGVFCDALEILSRRIDRKFKVTFLGRPGKIAGLDALAYLSSRAKRWKFEHRVLSDINHDSALKFLDEGTRLAVMPSLEDNLPNTVLECLCARIPFVAAATGGIPEMIAQSDLSALTFALEADALARKLEQALRDGVRTGSPAIDPEENRKRWIDWHRGVNSCKAEPVARKAAYLNGARPLVSICLVHRDRPALLKPALASIETQDWPRIEVVLVDDGSVTPEAIDEVSRLEAGFRARNWQLVRESKGSVGAARNAGARRASGEFILFTDVENVAKPEEVSTFLKAMAHGGADMLTCALDFFHGGDSAQSATHLVRRPFLGGAALPGIFRNCFGDRTLFTRKDAFHQIGGFAEDYGAGSEDWEFLAKAALRGFKIESVPRALVWRRVSDESKLRTVHEFDDRMRTLRPFQESLPESLKILVPYAFALQKGASALASDGCPNTAADLVLADARVREMAEAVRKSDDSRLAGILAQWVEFRIARSSFDRDRWKRARQVGRLLFKGHYHRFAHGFDSALRDLRKDPQTATPD